MHPAFPRTNGQVVEDLDEAEERVLVPDIGPQRPEVGDTETLGQQRGLIDHVPVINAWRRQRTTEVAGCAHLGDQTGEALLGDRSGRDVGGSTLACRPIRFGS